MICQHTQQVIIISITLHFLHHGVMIDTPSLARPTHDQSDVTSIALYRVYLYRLSCVISVKPCL